MTSNEKCGNIFLNEKGITIFHCALCERKYSKIQKFGIHVIDKHYALDDDLEADDLMPDFSDIVLEQEDLNKETLKDFIFETDEEESEISEAELADNDEQNEQCGEVNLTPEGILIFLCTLCNNQFEGIREFDPHVLSEHYSTEILEEVQLEILNRENDRDDTNFVSSNEIDFDCLIDESQCDDDNPMNVGQKISEEIKVQETRKSKRPVAKWKEVFETFQCAITNREKYRCKLCGAVIHHQTNTTHHIRRVHEKTKPHKCPECPKSCHSKTELRIHIRKHTGERPYLCMDCGEAYMSASELHRHRKAKHTKHERDKICPACGKSFFTTKDLQTHMSVHSEERPFKCKVCNTEFKAKKSLSTHMRIHEDKRSYKCNFCSASYNYKNMLTSHMKTKHDLI